MSSSARRSCRPRQTTYAVVGCAGCGPWPCRCWRWPRSSTYSPWTGEAAGATCTRRAEAAMVEAIADWFAVTALFHTHWASRSRTRRSYPPARTPSPAASRSSSPTTSCPDLSSGTRCCGRCLQSGSNTLDLLPEHSRRVVDEAAVVGGPVSVGSETRMSRPSSMSCHGWRTNRSRRSRASCSVTSWRRALITASSIWPSTKRTPGWSATRRPSATSWTRALWWTPQWLDDKVVGRMHHEAIAWVADIRDSPHHHARVALDDFLRQTALDLQHDADTMARGPPQARLLGQPQVTETATGLWRALSKAIQVSLEDPASTAVPGRHRLVELGGALARDEALAALERVHRGPCRVRRRALWHRDHHGDHRHDRGLDGEEAARRIELHVGRTSSSSGSTERSSGPGRTAHPRPYPADLTGGSLDAAARPRHADTPGPPSSTRICSGRAWPPHWRR